LLAYKFGQVCKFVSDCVGYKLTHSAQDYTPAP